MKKKGKAQRPASQERREPGHEEMLRRLAHLGEVGRRPLEDFLRVSESVETELRTVRSFFFDLFCMISGIGPEDLETEQGKLLRFRFFQELSKGSTVEEVKDIFIRNLYITQDPSLAPLKRPRPPRATNLAARARTYIEEHYGERLSLKIVADHVAVSKEHLSRAFKRAYDLTVTEYIQRVRVDMAKSLIQEGALSFKEICYELGYQSYNDFYRNFRKITGKSPKEYEEEIR
jgi:YesN/AraC family two-component response regulator